MAKKRKATTAKKPRSKAARRPGPKSAAKKAKSKKATTAAKKKAARPRKRKTPAPPGAALARGAPPPYKCQTTLVQGVCLRYERNPATGQYDLPLGGQRVSCSECEYFF
jgi:hypothetical protein